MCGTGPIYCEIEIARLKQTNNMPNNNNNKTNVIIAFIFSPFQCKTNKISIIWPDALYV